MKDRIALYLLTSLALGGVFTLPACVRRPIPHPKPTPSDDPARCPQLKATDKARVPTNKAQSLRFDDKATGRSIVIGMYGNLLNLCNVRPRERYAFAYPDPQSPGKEKVVYYADEILPFAHKDPQSPGKVEVVYYNYKKKSFGLKPISLTSNPPAGAVEHGQEVTITAVVATDDGLFQSTHEFRWTAGNDDLEVTRTIKKMVLDAVPLWWFNVILTLKAREFSRSEDKASITYIHETCPPEPVDAWHPKDEPMSLKVSKSVALAIDKSSNSAKVLRGELSHDYYPLPKKAGKYDVVFGLKGDSSMKDQSLTLNYVYRLEPKVSK